MPTPSILRKTLKQGSFYKNLYTHTTILYNSNDASSATSSSSTTSNTPTINTGGRTSSAVSAIKKQDDAMFQTKLDLNPPKGTRDFYPEDKRLSNWLFNHWRAIAATYGFEEYDAPVLEKEILYIRKSGDEVTGQLYNFVDKGENRVSLRPEMTPSLARMVLAKKNTLSFPLKWFSLPQCWRYERMTRGRRREHYQWNMDIWGVPGVEAEVELLSAVVTCFQNLGLTSLDVGIKINSRKILEDIMQVLTIPETYWASACVQVDKLDKLPAESVIEELSKLGIENTAATKLVEALKMKNVSEFNNLLNIKDSKGIQDINKIFLLAKAYGIEDWLQFDPSVVRGLSYYTGVVFEGYDKTGTLRAICGGGRYDKLIETMSGGETSLPAVGFGFGDAVIIELLKMKNILPQEFSNNKINVFVYYMSSDTSSLQIKAINAATQLRKAGLIVEILLEDKKAKWAFQRADKSNADFVVMYAETESNKGEVVVKDMKNSQQHTIKDEELVNYLTKNKINI